MVGGPQTGWLVVGVAKTWKASWTPPPHSSFSYSSSHRLFAYHSPGSTFPHAWRFGNFEKSLWWPHPWHQAEIFNREILRRVWTAFKLLLYRWGHFQPLIIEIGAWKLVIFQESTLRDSKNQILCISSATSMRLSAGHTLLDTVIPFRGMVELPAIQYKRRPQTCTDRFEITAQLYKFSIMQTLMTTFWHLWVVQG